MKTATITKEIAEVVAENVAEAFRAWSYELLWEDGKLVEDANGDLVTVRSKYGPRVVEGYSDFGGYSIVWEEGSPYGWTHLTGGGIEEEFGFTVEAVELPDEVEYLEAIDGIAVLIIPKES